MTGPHPWPAGLDITDPNAAQVAAALPPVVLPHLWRALAEELSRWQAGGDWNSRLHIGPVGSGPEMALYMTQLRRFGAPAAGALPPRVLLDATADDELLAFLFEAPMAVERAEVVPPPNMRHIAVRTGKRYGKTSLTTRHGRDLDPGARSPARGGVASTRPTGLLSPISREMFLPCFRLPTTRALSYHC